MVRLDQYWCFLLVDWYYSSNASLVEEIDSLQADVQALKLSKEELSTNKEKALSEVSLKKHLNTSVL